LDRPALQGKKIGQSYELFSGSNLSLCNDSSDPEFVGELADRDSAQLPSRIANSVPLSELIADSADKTLGREAAEQRGSKINFLIKFTQALGNSFQVHPVDGHEDEHWRHKAESWYFFEPGLMTLGVKKGAWQAYQMAVEAINDGMHAISRQVKSGSLTYEQAKPQIAQLIKRYDPRQFVNLVDVAKDDVYDLTAGGIHHSWEEDKRRIPLGNVLIELQTEAMDDVSTLRCFDCGKMGPNGELRDVHIKDYFRLANRTDKANDPQTYHSLPKKVAEGEGFELISLLDAKYYSLNKLMLKAEGDMFSDKINQFRHIFVKSGKVEVSTPGGRVTVGTGHSCFVPAHAGEYRAACLSPNAEVLISGQ